MKTSSQETKLRSHNFGLTIVLSMITLGLYIPIWFMIRKEEINGLVKGTKFPNGLVYALLILFIPHLLSVLVIFVMEFLPFEVILLIMLSSQFFGLIATIVFLVLCFRVRGILGKHIKEKGYKNCKASGVLTFLFTIMYLDYKITELAEMDQKNN